MTNQERRDKGLLYIADSAVMQEQALKRLFGYCETLCAYNTYQFNDYSRYDVAMFKEEDKARQREEQFPKDLQNAFDLGKRLVAKAKELNV